MRRASVACLVILLGAPSALAQVAGKVLSIQGQVEVQESPWAPAAVNQVLQVGAGIRTGDQSRAVILLADETQIKLNNNSNLVLRQVRQASNLLTRVAAQASGDESVLNLLKGQAWLRSKLKPVRAQVTTPAVTAAIRGTEFDIRVADDGETIATVLEGLIDMRNDQGFVTVNPGEQGQARIGQAPTKRVILNPEDAVQWVLVYSAAVSPRDYPFITSSPADAKASLAAAAADPIRQAQLQHDAGDLPAALDALKGLTSPEATETRGWILLEQNRLREALEEFNRAPAQASRVRLGLSLAHYRLNQMSEAYKYVEDPGADDLLKMQKGMLDLISGDTAGSQALLESVPQSGSSYGLVQALLSGVYLSQNRKDKALEAAQRAIQAAPGSPSGYLSLSQVQQSMFDLAAATRSVERALSLDPDFLQAQVQYAKLLYGAGKSGEAEQVIRRSLAIAPDEASVHATLGFILLGRGQTEEALLAFDRSLRMDSTQGEPHMGLGIANMRAGRYPEAVTEFLAAASLEPRISLYQSYLGKAFYEQRKFEQAFSALEAARELDPRDPTPRLYAGIFYDDLNRPGLAVQDLEDSIRLNENRAVYRSRFVLDEDRATRNVNLARAYNRLGLSEWGNLQALKSTLSDPASSSAHLFLAGTFLNLKGRTLAAGGELLLTRLLLPVNANSFNSFNDYTTLFELPRRNFSVEGTAGSLGSRGGSLISNGGASRYAYSSVFRYDQNDGFRPINDDSTDYTSVNFFKFALSPHSDLLFSAIHTQTRAGDHGAASPLVNEENSESRRNHLRSTRAEIGYHLRLRPGSELVMVFSGQTNKIVTGDPKSSRIFFPPFPPVDVELRHESSTPNVNLQASHMFKISRLQFRYGLDIFEGRSVSRDTFVFPSPFDPTDLIIQDLEPEKANSRYKTFFLQADCTVTPRFVLTGGLSYDWANYKLDVLEYDHPISRWNPRAGFLYSPFDSTTLRFAAMSVLQTHQQESLAPTHLNGFLYQQNEFPLTESNSYNFGLDQRFGKSTFLRTTAFLRNRTTPVFEILPSGEDARLDSYGDFYGTAVTLNHFLTRSWTLVPEYTLTHSKDDFGIRHDHEGSLGMFYIHPSGLSLGVKEKYLNQHGLLGEEPTSVSVYTTDLSVSYEFPRKIGLLSFQVTNLTDKNYTFLADPLALDPRVPKRQAKLLLRLNF